VDLDWNGNPDAIPVDTDGDGVDDAQAIDTNGDNFPDTLVRDLDRDGVFESVVEIAEPSPPPVPQPCSLQFSVETTSVNGQYAPRNAGALWVSSGSDAFIRTFNVWAERRVEHVHQWVAQSGQNRVDAISGATEPNHRSYLVTWDCRNLDGTFVPDGTYVIHVEQTEINGQGPYLEVPFERGPALVDLTPADQQGFRGIHLTYSPQAVP
jgi:hypothetical protein